VVVSGRVQGVFFRDSCQRQAAAAGVQGWVRNTNSGDVEAVFEGGGEAVDKMVAWCRVGPSRAMVTSVRVTEEDPEGLTNFRVVGY
jgi:acylphosphatase